MHSIPLINAKGLLEKAGPKSPAGGDEIPEFTLNL
jgi:hypothetical protein